MTKPFSTSRRNFLKTTALAAGGATLGVPLTAPNPQATVAQPARTISASQATSPPNKMSAVLPAVNSTILLRTPHVIKEIAPGVNTELWSYEGSAPGPILHVKEGEEVKFTLDNNSGVMGHSMDFHAALLPWDKFYQNVPTGEKHSFNWTPQYPGVFMYHCGTPPVLMHLANGMHGAIVVQPKNGWPTKADREYVLVQHEYYLGEPDEKGVQRGDFAKMSQIRPDFVVFNGYANQYQTEPLVANPGELVRFHVCNCGPSIFSAFHVIGTIFVAAYADGNSANKQVGMQTVTIPPGGGYTVDVRINDEGLYPFVTHSFAHTGLGALGVLKVGNPPMPGNIQH
jgi:nitrite reductase (NO-forming)